MTSSALGSTVRVMPAAPKLKTREAAEHLGIPYRTLRHFVADRRIPFYKVGTMLLFDRDELDRWLETQKVEAVD